MSVDFLFSSESVSEGHPDKVADQISDAVLDAILAEDPRGRVACEAMVSTGLIVISGEITTKAHINYRDIAQKTPCAALVIPIQTLALITKAARCWRRSIVSRPTLRKA